MSTIDVSAIRATPLIVCEPYALDFVNTVAIHDGPSPYDDLATYPELLLWGYQTGILDEPNFERLLDAGQREPAGADAVLERTWTLRGTLYGLYSAAIEGRSPEVSDLDALNSELARSMSQVRMAARGTALVWDWDVSETDLDRVLWPVAKWAADLLSEPGELASVGECGSFDCQCLFVDTSKNHSRRFCSEECSNRTRSRRFRERASARRGK